MGAGRHLYADGKEVEVPSIKGGSPPRRFTRHCAGLGTPSKDKDALGEGEHDELVRKLNPLWVMVSCGYMVSWTSIGSLISYFKARQGAKFYVRLYCSFYLPGLPISLLQQRYDAAFDARLGSSRSFLLRLTFGLSCKACLLLLIPGVPRHVPIERVPSVMLLIMATIGAWASRSRLARFARRRPRFARAPLFSPARALFFSRGETQKTLLADARALSRAPRVCGTFSWLCHGTRRSSAHVPAELDRACRPASARPSSTPCSSSQCSPRLQGRRPLHTIFYYCTACAARARARDAGARDPERALPPPLTPARAARALRSPRAAAVVARRRSSSAWASPRGSSRRRPPRARARAGRGGAAASSPRPRPRGSTRPRAARTTPASTRSSRRRCSTAPTRAASQEDERACVARARALATPPPPPPPCFPLPPARAASPASRRALSHRPARLRARALLLSRRALSSYVERLIRPCRLALFLNIWSSIFTAAFFAYVQPQSDFDIEELLYFIRLFSDLLGRPLARMVRPSWAREPNQLVWIACGRLSLMAVFFLYIAGGHGGWFPQSDVFITLVTCVFSVASGYLAVLSYEYAAAAGETKAAQAYAGTRMNTAFQIATFTSVVAGVAVSSLNILQPPKAGGGANGGGSAS